MAIAAAVVVETFKGLLDKSGRNVITLSMPEFYELAERDRMKAEFIATLTKQMLASSLLFIQGNAVVLIAKDYAFEPLKSPAIKRGKS